MTNKCARPAKAGLIGGLGAALIASALVVSTTAQSGDPSTLPLLSASSLQYLGGFRLPAGSANGDFSFGERPLAFNPATNSLYVGSAGNGVAEVSIPVPVNTSNVNAMPFATYLQPFADPTEGHLRQIDTSGVQMQALMVYGNRLYGTAAIYYDANNTQTLSHFSRSLQLNQASFSGWSRVWEPGKTGFVAGSMAPIPSEWQAKLGGTAITGLCCVPITHRTSQGPSAFAFNPAQVGQATVPAQPLLYYPSDHPTLGVWDSSNPTYGATTQITGVVIVAGTRTVLYVGNNGVGPHCYGNGTSDPNLAGVRDADGNPWCYDPTNSYKGQHAYPYYNQVWAYDLNDFVAVKEGRKQPWDVVPYGVWRISLPTPDTSRALGGVGYDSQRQIFYVSQLGSDTDTFAYRPIIHAFHLNVAGAPPTAPPPPTATATGVTVTSNKVAPQAANTAVTFTAAVTGTATTYQYKWWVNDGVTQTALTTWGAANRTTIWTPTVANTKYVVSVWVRSATSTVDTADVTAGMPFPISGGAATPAAVSMTANRVAPQAPFTPITWTATPTGGVAPHQYKWLVSDGTTTTTAVNWAATNSFIWTPSTTNPNYRVTVWVRSAGNTADAQEASAFSVFPIAAPANTTTPVSSVTLNANKVAPQTTGSTIVWTSAPTGGTAPLAYKWLISTGNGWTTAANWSSNATFSWTPSVANANYRVAVWVKRASNAADQAEASAERAFAITAVATTTPPPVVTTPPPVVTTPPPVVTTPSPLSHVTIASNKPSPLSTGTMVVFTAQAVGGAGPHQYQWWVFDGERWDDSDWSTARTFSWTPTRSDPGYQVRVKARSAGSTAEVTATMSFVVK